VNESGVPEVEVPPSSRRSLLGKGAIDAAAAAMYALQSEVLKAQRIPVQGTGREAYRS